VKRLSAVEADTVRSHQHEFNGVGDLKKIFGPAPESTKFDARFITSVMRTTNPFWQTAS